MRRQRATDLRELTGRGCASQSSRMLERLQVTKERGNPILPPCAMQGRHYRKACCWNSGIEMSKKAKAIGKAEG